MAPALQISIPTTSIATPSTTSDKPYTLYHLTLRLPLRTHTVQKRYNDFIALNTALTSTTGSAPPAPLPPKSWLRSTLHNEALTERRRAGLESYARAILEADDARWRSSAAWRAFLNLPGGENNALTKDGGFAKTAAVAEGGGAGGVAITDAGAWLDAHREVKKQIASGRALIKQREGGGGGGTTAAEGHRVAAEAKACLVRAAAGIARLEDGLKVISGKSESGGGSRIGEGEVRRRRDLISAARSEVEGLEGVLKSLATRNAARAGTGSGAGEASAVEKEALWKGTAAGSRGGRTLGGGPLKETERTRELDNTGVLQLQQQVMQEQDEDVMALGKTVARLKDMGIMINEELAIQNEMLTMVDQDVDRVQGKVDVARRRIGKLK